MKAVTRSLLEELFYSERRKAVDSEIYRVITTYVENEDLRENLLYHFKIDKHLTPTLEHSKRLRSFLCLLFAEENGFDLKEILPLAVVVEIIHNSTLIIDDIQDNDAERCGEPALWKKVGVPKAVHAGYFLSNIAFAYYNKILLEGGYFNYSQKMLEALNGLFSGQQLDLDFERNKSIETYKKLAKGKTGELLLLSSVFGAMPYGFDNTKFNALKAFADAFSVYYQIRDDYSDIKNKNERIDSSNIGNMLDLKDIHALLKMFDAEIVLSITQLQKLSLIKSNKLNCTFEELRLEESYR
jgi:geranylgeranyl diphosphate synthase type I